MRALARRAGASLLLAAVLSPTTPTARADDLLVMPYACTMVGGRPLLTRAPEQSHRIIGLREQRAHTACSPLNPEMCRTWTLHRFDLSCEGARVPWVAVVASVAEETTRRAWIEGDRLLLRMPPTWSFEPGDPCARPPGFDERFGFGRMRRYCADRRAMAPPPVVAMPAGFAPMLGIDGIFVRSTSPSAGSDLPPPPAVAATPPRLAHAEPPQAPLRSEAAQPPAARPELPSEPASKDAPSQRSAPPKTQAQAPVPPAPAAKVQPPAPQPSSPAPAATSGGPVIPKIINRPDSASTDVPEQTRPVTTISKQEPADPAKSGLNPPPTSGQTSAQQPPAPPKAGLERDDPAVTINLLSAVRNPTTGIIAFGGLALVLLGAFALARRRERLAGPQARDIASVSLDRGQGRPVQRPDPHPGPRPGPPALRQPVAMAPSPPRTTPAQQATLRPPAWMDRIPHTRNEALQMLGMGVSPDATETAMKKIVDGLRLSWHPDLAKDETDRQLREFRVKQINAAWELIQGRRMERLDS